MTGATVNDFLIRLHQLRNQVDACMAQGIPQDQLEQCAAWCNKTYRELLTEADVTPNFRQQAEIQRMLGELEPLINTWLNLKR